VRTEIINARIRPKAGKRFLRLDKAFADAVRSRTRSAIVEVLQRAQLPRDLARRTAEKILADRRRRRVSTS
jgi:hypothetical protein